VRTQTISMENLVELLFLQLEHGCATLAVTGISMLPMLRHGKDLVRLEQLERSPRSGDVLLYRRESGQYILHRVVREEQNGNLWCSGDNQWEKEAVHPNQALAVVSAFCRKGKWYTVDHLGYRLYVWLWVGVFPIRKPILALRRRLGRLRHWIKCQRYRHSCCDDHRSGMIDQAKD